MKQVDCCRISIPALQHLKLTVVSACFLDVYFFKIINILKYIHKETFSPCKLLTYSQVEEWRDR